MAAQSGGAPSLSVDLTLWELSSVIDGQGHIHQHQTDQETVSVAVSGATPWPFSFTAGPDFLANNNHEISLAAYQTGLPGPMFRSGRFETLPPGSPGNPAALVDVMLIDQMRTTMASINSMLAASLPITLPDGNTISTATLTSAPPSNVITLVATGPYGATTYTYTLGFTIDPSNDQVDLTQVLEANAVGQGSITFAAGPGGGFQAFLDNLFAGLFVGRITSQVIPDITSRLNQTAAAAAASAAAAVGVSQIPAGVVLGARSVAVASNGDLVVSAALGSLGPLLDKFASASAPQGGGCFIATAALGADAPELVTLRAYRDEILARSVGGRLFIGVYERTSPPIARLLERSDAARALTRTFVVRPAASAAAARLRRPSGPVEDPEDT